jgi:hypothetical protein
LCWAFSRWGHANYLPQLTSNHNPPDVSLLGI